MDSNALFKIGYGLYVLTTNDYEKDNGCIINSVMQVTQNPMTLVASVNKGNYSCDTIKKTGIFNISVLDESAPFEVFTRFGFQSGRDADKLSGFKPVKRAENGLLYLSEYSNAFISCRVSEAVDFSTHTLFKAEITGAEVLSGRETMTYSFYHKAVKPQPKPVSKAGWRCNICGYVYEGAELPADFVCPICKHGASDFTKIEL